MESGDDELAARLTLDHRGAKLTTKQRLLCDFAVKLTLAPGNMVENDLQRLRQVGYDDTQLQLATQVISYFNYINRMADALGVDAESWMEPDKIEWMLRKGRDYAY